MDDSIKSIERLVSLSIGRYIRVRLEKLLSFDGELAFHIRRCIAAVIQEKCIYDSVVLSEWPEWPVVALKQWRNGIPEGYEYRSFKVRKKGGHGFREIDSPNHDLMQLQKRVYHKLLKRLRPHESATGFVQGKSIIDNATPHIGRAVVINIDLKDFFSSISWNRVYRGWRFLGWDVEASTILTNICCYRKRLPQGAPTSPALSNLCNNLLDARLEGVSKKGGGRYTRYADDLTLSFPTFDDRHRGILRRVFQILASEDYEIQKKKRIRFQRSHQRQATTGIIVNNKLNLPRETRRKVRAMRYHLSKGLLPTEKIRTLEGFEALQSMIDKANQALQNQNGQTAPSNTPKVKKICILFLAANPQDTDSLQLQEEARRMDDSLRRAQYRDEFDIRSHWAVQINDLQTLLFRYKPDIVHFSGHGSKHSEIVLHDTQGNSIAVPQKALSDLFRILKGKIKCVVLNACYSSEQANAIAEHIPVVIGLSGTFSDKAAIEFTSAYYQALGYGQDVKTAFELSRNSINLHGLPDGDEPVLICKHDSSRIKFV